MSREPENRLTQEVIGLLLLGAGTLLFLALISYDANDVPGWFPLSHSATSSGGSRQTIFGMTGAILACVSNFFLGSASFFLAVVLFGYGAIKLICPGWRILRRVPWAAAFILSAASLAHFQPSFLHLFLRNGFLNDYAKQMHLQGAGNQLWPGGLLGYGLGEAFRALFDRPGSLIILSGLYLASLVLMTGIHPVLLIRKLIELGPILVERFRQWRIARADANGRLELERKRLEQEARKLEKQLKRKGIKPLEAAPEPTDEPEPEDPAFDPDRPAPQVIDTQAASSRKREPAPKEKAEPLVAKDPVHLEDYQLPGLDLLEELNLSENAAADPEELLKVQATLIDTLAQFGVAVAPGDITRGPTITRYEIYPAKGVSVDKIVSRERDIARATRAERINILAPIPGKDTVGIEIANSRKQKVAFRELMESDDWAHAKGRIPLVLGKDVYGKAIMGDLAAMPHLLVAGATGSGKSVCINSIIASILYRFKPEELRFIMIDPKVVEMQIYNTLPHLVIPVVTDPKKVLLALRWVIDEMEKRYKIFAKTGVRNITSFNARPKPKSQKELDAEADEAAAQATETAPWETPEAAEDEGEALEEEKPPLRVRRDDEIDIPEGAMSYIVVIIDELADLMQTAPADVESAIARITQMARAAGIHMIVATQTPRAEVITGVIKANIPSRIAFQVASGLDSRIILDEKGAERLLGQGDMLYQPPGTSRMTRAQGVLVTDEEIKRIVDFASAQGEPSFDREIHQRLSGEGTEAEELSDEDEELVQKCIEIMKQEKKASTSLFQRRLRLGYTRAARVVDILEQRGYVAAGEGAKPREILVDLDTLL